MKTKHILVATVGVLAFAATALWLLRSHSSGGNGRLAPASVATRQPVGSATPPELDSGTHRQDQFASAQAMPSQEPEAPVTATVHIVRGDKTTMELKSHDSEFDRVLVEPNELLTIRLALNGFDPSREIRVTADNGGCLIGGCNRLVLMPRPESQTVEFQFAVGGFRGRCTVLVTQDQRQELLSFWVGPDLPRGQPGPRREFNPDKT